MGIIIAKFGKKNTFQILEKLQNEITEIEEFSRTTENTKRKIIGRFIALSLTTYSLLALGVYFYYHKISPNQKLIYTLPLIAIPVVIYVIKHFLTWYYGRKIRKNQLKLVKLKAEKKKILEKVEETETYKVAKEILDKFGDINKKPIVSITDATPLKSSKSVSSVVNPIQSALRQRTVVPSDVNSRLFKNVATPMNQDIINKLETPKGYIPSIGPAVPSTSSALQLPRPILPLRKTIIDKMFDFLVGDGPSNSCALICKNCFSHNGMALKEEFEYLPFRCCYCGFFNPSRKRRPPGPKFESQVSPSRTLTSKSSDSDNSSDEGSKPIITEIVAPEDTINSLPQEDTIDSLPQEDNTPSLSQEDKHDLLDCSYSPIETQSRGDSQSSAKGGSKNPFEPEANSREDEDSGNPFGEYDSENETTNTAQNDKVKPETKED